MTNSFWQLEQSVNDSMNYNNVWNGRQ